MVLGVTFGTVPVHAQGTVPGQFVVPLGYCQINATALGSAVGLSSCAGGIPTGATMALFGAETAEVRWRDDGVAPTATVGSLIATGNPGIFYTGTLRALQFIAATGSPLLNVSFYR
jgi:hypothetical protein